MVSGSRSRGSPRWRRRAYGIGLAHDDKPLRDRVNGILEDALSAGTWRDIYDRTLGRSGVAPGVPKVRPD